MAPLPVESTGRVWIDYVTGVGATSQEHTVMLRFNGSSGGTVIGALAVLGDTLAAPGAGSYITGWQALRARAAVAGQVVSIPQTLPLSLQTFVGTGVGSVTRQDEAREFRLVGRGVPSGRRGSLSIYGLLPSLFTSADFRISRTAETVVDDYLTVLEDSDSGYALNIAGERLTWYPYANWQYNSYWEGELRQ